MIPITEVRLPPTAEALVLEVLRSGHLAQGPFVERLEDEFASACGVRHAVAVSNGTVSLQLAMLALGIGPGDEVITTPFTFVGTINAVLSIGASVRFVDIDPRTFCIDASQIEAQITPRTVAVVPVHLYGQPADMGAISAIADRNGLAVIEDAAQAHGASFMGQPVGSFGVGSFSFYATKNITTGEGGMVTTNDESLADRLRLLRNQGMRERYDYEMVGYNARMTDLQAAVGVAELAELGSRTARRIENAASLSERLHEVQAVETPTVVPGRRHVFHQYTVRVGEGSKLTRGGLASALGDRRVGTGIYYPSTVHGHKCYSSHPRVGGGTFPEALRAAAEVLSLPVHPHLSAADVALVAEAVHDVLDAPS